LNHLKLSGEVKLARMDKGAWGIMKVDGEENPEIFLPLGKTNEMKEKMS
jgi:hypothetical protein